MNNLQKQNNAGERRGAVIFVYALGTSLYSWILILSAKAV